MLYVTVTGWGGRAHLEQAVLSMLLSLEHSAWHCSPAFELSEGTYSRLSLICHLYLQRLNISHPEKKTQKIAIYKFHFNSCSLKPTYINFMEIFISLLEGQEYTIHYLQSNLIKLSSFFIYFSNFPTKEFWKLVLQVYKCYEFLWTPHSTNTNK